MKSTPEVEALVFLSDSECGGAKKDGYGTALGLGMEIKSMKDVGAELAGAEDED